MSEEDARAEAMKRLRGHVQALLNLSLTISLLQEQKSMVLKSARNDKFDGRAVSEAARRVEACYYGRPLPPSDDPVVQLYEEACRGLQPVILSQ